MTNHAVSFFVQTNFAIPAREGEAHLRQMAAGLPDVAIAVVLLLALWPVRSRAVALLRRWGVDDPTDVETDDALSYLRRRRLAYPGLYLTVRSARCWGRNRNRCQQWRWSWLS